MIERVEVDQRSLRKLVIALRRESDGRELARDLTKQLYDVAVPARDAARAAIMSMSSKGQTVGRPLRATVAARTLISVHLGGRRPGVAIRAHKSGMPRGFINAPKRLNSRRGWRRQVYGGPWVSQMGKPGWFDDTMRKFQPAARRAAQRVQDEMAERVARRAKG